MIPAQRRVEILEIIRRRGAVAIAELAELLNASASTIRRDLDDLAGKGYVERSHGGAHLAVNVAGTTFEHGHEIVRHTHETEKRSIGRLAEGLIDEGSSVYFDSSSTVLEAARAVASTGKQITAITNDLEIALSLSSSSAVSTIVPGGTVRSHSRTLLGEPGLGFLKRTHVNLAIIGVHSLADGVLSDASIEVVQPKQAILGSTSRSVVLADASKFSQPRAFIEFSGLGEVDDLVTDDSATEEQLRAISDAGISLHVAKHQ